MLDGTTYSVGGNWMKLGIFEAFFHPSQGAPGLQGVSDRLSWVYGFGHIALMLRKGQEVVSFLGLCPSTPNPDA